MGWPECDRQEVCRTVIASQSQLFPIADGWLISPFYSDKSMQNTYTADVIHTFDIAMDYCVHKFKFGTQDTKCTFHIQSSPTCTVIKSTAFYQYSFWEMAPSYASTRKMKKGNFVLFSSVGNRKGSGKFSPSAMT